jgi:serine/threonine protein kinase
MSAEAIAGIEWVRPLGRGSVTEVFAVRSTTSAERFALKRIRPAKRNDPLALHLLKTEARVGLAIQHPNVIRTVAAHLKFTPRYLLLEWLEGETLRRRLNRQHKFSWRAIAEILRDCAAGLAALHGKGFIHGDIKPDNIYLLRGGGTKIIDLGFAHRPNEHRSMQEEGYVLGTAQYVAPELCEDQSIDDYSSDLFSLGVTAFEMFTRRLPYPFASSEELLRLHRDTLPELLVSTELDTPRVLIELVNALLSRRPKKRPSAANLQKEMTRLLAINRRLAA